MSVNYDALAVKVDNAQSDFEVLIKQFEFLDKYIESGKLPECTPHDETISPVFGGRSSLAAEAYSPIVRRTNRETVQPPTRGELEERLADLEYIIPAMASLIARRLARIRLDGKMTLGVPKTMSACVARKKCDII